MIALPITHDCRVAATSFWIPRLGMTFSSLDEAWEFWVTYGGRMGFDVRKSYTNTSNLDGLVTSSRFVCQIRVLVLKIKGFVLSRVIELRQEQAA